ncbi:MAG: prephenate dehydrogenase/arogenate dehydrogenase family protein [Proteobacteria bacterium]|nr:prephenate dehydrogenase/arogenate dehydrogenase family protein [Pseudomonadota bacterium]MCL2306996.1 prephenate dehydrogenase/arogenate dehydrogenase family protein [Pseudomonadota bacterium]
MHKAPSPVINKLIVFGVGLIGGSCALALKARGAVGEVVGIGRTRANLDDALRGNMIDRAYTLDEDWTQELRNADVVLLAVPVAQMEGLLKRILPVVAKNAVITDAGSTKQDVVAAARCAYSSCSEAAFARFVPAHPIAGTEHSGAAAAFATLYENKHVIVAPLPETDADAVQKVVTMWQTCGAQTLTMPPEQHDRIFAAVSHLPHLLAFALVAELAGRPEAETFFMHAGSGFRDFTRIAGSSPEMWRDIALANRDALLEELDRYQTHLNHMRDELKRDDGAALEARMKRASDARRHWEKVFQSRGRK